MSTPEALERDRYFMMLARAVALKSKDRSKQVGTLIVDPESHAILSAGYNGPLRGAPDDEPWIHDRPAKYDYLEHAERNAVYNAARHGISLQGAIAYLESPPCVDCLHGLHQAGISELVCTEDHQFSEDERWIGSILKAIEVAGVVGLPIRYIDAPARKFLL